MFFHVHELSNLISCRLGQTFVVSVVTPLSSYALAGSSWGHSIPSHGTIMSFTMWYVWYNFLVTLYFVLQFPFSHTTVSIFFFPNSMFLFPQFFNLSFLKFSFHCNTSYSHSLCVLSFPGSGSCSVEWFGSECNERCTTAAIPVASLPLYAVPRCPRQRVYCSQTPFLWVSQTQFVLRTYNAQWCLAMVEQQGPIPMLSYSHSFIPIPRFPNDSKTWDIQEQFMWGSALLISPVLTAVQYNYIYIYTRSHRLQQDSGVKLLLPWLHQWCSHISDSLPFLGRVCICGLGRYCSASYCLLLELSCVLVSSIQLTWNFILYMDIISRSC